MIRNLQKYVALTWCMLLLTSTPDLNAQNTTFEYNIDSTTLFANPERGWARSYNPSGNTPAPDLVLGTLQYWRASSDHITLARKYYMLHAYLDKPIDQAFLDKFQKDLNTCRTAGVKMIPRFIYIWDPATVNKDAPLNIAIQHIEQIRPYLQNNWDVIAFLETGFVGQWGEWHHSNWNYIDNYSNQLKDDGITVRDSLLSALPANRFLMMRYMYWHKYKFWPTPLNESQAFSGTKQARLGYHHDYIMGGNQWDCEMGGSNQPSYQTAHGFLMEDTKWVPHTGEPCGDSYYDTHDPQPELRAVHQSSLMNNACIDYSKWKSKPWYEGLTRDLGYRISIKKATISNIVPGENLSLTLDLTNSGYAAPFNERKFEIILRNQTTGEQYVTDVTRSGGHATDPRYWLPGNFSVSLSIPVPLELAAGEYDILLNLPDPAPSFYSRPEYSIRLANQNMWEAATGYNVLKGIITTGMSTVKSPKFNMDIYPNPASNQAIINCQFSEKGKAVVTIYNILGKVVMEEIFEHQSASDHELNINTQQFKAGIYFVRLSVNGEQLTQKLIVNKQ